MPDPNCDSCDSVRLEAGHAPVVPGKTLPVPPSRRLIGDLMYFASLTATPSVLRECNVARLLSRNSHQMPRISWTAIFLKAYGLVSIRHPELRRVYLPWPYCRFYEHSRAVCRMAMVRYHESEERVFFARFVEPGQQSLTLLQQQIDEFKNAPIDALPRYRRQVLASKLPRLLRRVIWWLVLNAGGCSRAERFGTFGLTTLSALGAVVLTPPSLAPTTLSFGPVSETGVVHVTLAFDHRVLDGMAIAQALCELEEILTGEIADELQNLRATRSSADVDDVSSAQ